MGLWQRWRSRNPGRSAPAMLGFEAIRFSVWVVVTLVYRLRCRGLEHVPTSGGLLLVVNHQSHLDAVAVGISLDRHVNFVARRGLFRNPLFGSLIRLLNSTPINEDGKSDTAAIRAALGQLSQGRVVLVFPEGRRSDTGQVQPFKRGVWLLLSRAKCAVLPVAVDGAFDAWPRGRGFPRLIGQRISVRVGPVIQPQDLLPMGPDRGLEHLRSVIDSLRLQARAELRQATQGRLPGKGPGDRPAGNLPLNA